MLIPVAVTTEQSDLHMPYRRTMKLSLLVVTVTISLIGNGIAFAPVRKSSAPRRTPSSRLWGKNDPMATEGDWSAFLDRDNTGMVYYFNAKTGESKWEPPTDTFPSFTMDAETRELAREKRLAYIEQNSQEEPKKKGFLASILTSNEEKKEEEPAVEKKEEAAAWYQGLFDIKDEPAPKETKTDAPAKKEKPVKKKETPIKITSDDENTGFLSNLIGRKGNNGAVKNKKADVKPLNLADKVFTAGDTRTLEVDASSFVLPHPSKVSWGGEDAVFVKGRSFGVFDGVSGAEKLDGIPLFSYTLADEMKRMMKEDGASTKEMIECLADASEFANRAATGASTALVASIGQDDFLRVLNLGDCACYVIRNGKVVAKSKEIVHYFDCPYQLSEDSPDRAQDGTKLNFEVLAGDVIVMGSDGVFDNLSQEMICETIAASPPKSNVMAKRIVDLTRKVSLDEDAPTPYAKLAKRNGFEDFQTGRGGKVDDVSCVVVRVT